MFDVTINDRQVVKQADFLKHVRTSFPQAECILLNNMAFAVRTLALQTISRVMVVRNPRYLSMQFRVYKSNARSLRAHLSMNARDRFSGLYQQEFGGTLQRHAATLAARGGKKEKSIASAARFKGDILKMGDIDIANVHSEAQRFTAFLEIMARKGDKRPFIIPAGVGFPAGLARSGGKMKGGPSRAGMQARPTRAVTVLRTFGSKGQKTIRKTPWMSPAIRAYLASARPRFEWERAITAARLLMRP